MTLEEIIIVTCMYLYVFITLYVAQTVAEVVNTQGDTKNNCNSPWMASAVRAACGQVLDSRLDLRF